MSLAFVITLLMALRMPRIGSTLSSFSMTAASRGMCGVVVGCTGTLGAAGLGGTDGLGAAAAAGVRTAGLGSGAVSKDER